MFLYRPLQFGTIVLSSASVASILSKSHYLIPMEWVINTAIVLGASALFFWAYWCWFNNFQLHNKLFLLAIILGCLVGVWL